MLCGDTVSSNRGPLPCQPRHRALEEVTREPYEAQMAMERGQPGQDNAHKSRLYRPCTIAKALQKSLQNLQLPCLLSRDFLKPTNLIAIADFW